MRILAEASSRVQERGSEDFASGIKLYHAGLALSARADRFTVHYTPTHGSWLNQAEIEIGMFSRQCLGKRRISSLKILKAEARAWNRRANRDHVKIAWKFDRKTARRKFGYNRKSFKRSKT